MTEHGDHEEVSGSMDISAHVRTWKLFTSLIKWNIVAAAILMLLLLVFRTNG